MGIDNPFGPPTMPSAITSNTVKAPENKPPIIKPSTEAKTTFNESVTKAEDNPDLEIIRKVLIEYNNIESDIPVNHNAYWAAKRRLNANG